MRKIYTAAFAALTLTQIASAAPHDTKASLEQLLNGRQAGKPLECLSLRTVRSSTIIEGKAVVFHAQGTLYVNQPQAGAEWLVRDKAILTNSDSGRICRGEVVELFDATTGVQSGSVFLGRFVPYRKKVHSFEPPHMPARVY
jgi:hypothetical protein